MVWKYIEIPSCPEANVMNPDSSNIKYQPLQDDLATTRRQRIILDK